MAKNTQNRQPFAENIIMKLKLKKNKVCGLRKGSVIQSYPIAR